MHKYEISGKDAKKFINLVGNEKSIIVVDDYRIDNNFNIVKENITSLVFEFIIFSNEFVGKKPPDEITVIDKLKETKDLKSKIFNIKKIKKVKNV